MPYKTDKLKLDNEFLDKRTKLLPCQKERVLRLHIEGVSIRNITKIMNVNRRLIQFVIFPERQAKNITDRNDRGGWKQYYDKSKWKEYHKKHRKYKYKVLTEFLT